MTGISPLASIPHPCAWQASLPIFGMGMRTRFVRILQCRTRTSVFDIGVISTNKKEASLRCLFLIGGDDGNRTRVQKPLDITFSVGSLSFGISRFPTPVNRLQELVALLCMTDTSANSRYMFTTDLTHGGSRSPHPRYGRLKSRVTAYAARATVLLSFII